MSISPELQGALKALDKEFRQLHITYGHATRSLCYWWLTDEWGADDDRYANLFNEWCDQYPALNERHRDLVTQRIPPSTFRAYFDFYIGMMAIGVHRIFAELVEIIPANEADGIAWAKAQAGNLIRSYRHLVADWVRVACDRKNTDKTVSQSWRAPRFLSMTPAGRDGYDPDRADERMDATSTLKLLDSFADEYVLKLGSQIEDEAGAKYKAAVRSRKPSESDKVCEGTSGRGQAHEDRREYAKTWEDVLKLKDDPDATWPIAAIASLLNVDQKTVRNRIRNDKLPKHATPGRVYVQTALRLREPKPHKRKKHTRRES